MKNLFTPLAVVVLALALFSGCSWQVGGGTKSATMQPTVGQQLIDLQKAKDAGVITEAEFQAKKAKLLHGN